ncbi:transglutaminase family protein [Amycolatopsis sp. 195334CR]|uniref:transglutaminase-like domain-containing protein n=1 Tax=Amycolatopsis sp. 195334CR TaxID=2814588 RepID=UPI0027DCAAAC|nr:transglutaminase family protein [Amycolatopsis sp. 195334CR]
MNLDAYRSATYFLDSDSAEVRAFTARVVGATADPATRAALLFEQVRESIRYSPFAISPDPADYRASAVIGSGSTWCVPKAVLLTAAARAAGIPARLGFADVRNHLTSPALRARMGDAADVFVYHGYSELFLDGRWVKAAPTFDSGVCARNGVTPITFDGKQDALLHEYSPDGRFMEYVADRGVHADLPLKEIMSTLLATYPVMRGGPSTV